ncbi:hypothetical protein BDZ97DRAFT_1754628 [Flammula alnicola]|nr:hypothetical protein BDZ97DRAFT_1754628 [Flammula alnicola]
MQFKLSALASVALATTLAVATLLAATLLPMSATLDPSSAATAFRVPALLLSLRSSAFWALSPRASPPRRRDLLSHHRHRCQRHLLSVCCTNDSFNGVVALGCTPINLAL